MQQPVLFGAQAEGAAEGCVVHSAVQGLPPGPIAQRTCQAAAHSNRHSSSLQAGRGIAGACAAAAGAEGDTPAQSQLLSQPEPAPQPGLQHISTAAACCACMWSPCNRSHHGSRPPAVQPARCQTCRVTCCLSTRTPLTGMPTLLPPCLLAATLLFACFWVQVRVLRRDLLDLEELL